MGTSREEVRARHRGGSLLSNGHVSVQTSVPVDEPNCPDGTVPGYDSYSDQWGCYVPPILPAVENQPPPSPLPPPPPPPPPPYDPIDPPTDGGPGGPGAPPPPPPPCADCEPVTPSVKCEGLLDYPHKSTHMPGTVNVVGGTVCDLTVYHISVTVYLHRWDALSSQWQLMSAGVKSLANAGAVSTNTADLCVTGLYHATSSHRYQATAADSVHQLPPGRSPDVQINC